MCLRACVSVFLCCVHGCPLMDLGSGLVVILLACAAPCRCLPLPTAPCCSRGWVCLGSWGTLPASGWVLARWGWLSGVARISRAGLLLCGGVVLMQDSWCCTWLILGDRCLAESWPVAPGSLALLLHGCRSSTWAGAWLSCGGLPRFSHPCSMGGFWLPGSGGTSCLLLIPGVGGGCGPLPPLLTTIYVKPLPHILHTYMHAHPVIHTHAHPTVAMSLCGFNNIQ